MARERKHRGETKDREQAKAKARGEGQPPQGPRGSEYSTQERYSDAGKWIGDQLRRARVEKEWTLDKLSKETKARHPLEKTISASYISRVENRGMIPHLQELMVLCDTLNLSLEEALPVAAPWYVVRKGKAEELLKEVISGERNVERFGDGHAYMIDKEFYRYEPLDDNPECVTPDERAGHFEDSLMRKYLFYASDKASSADLIRGLGNHSGEELIVILEGEMEAFLSQTKDGPPKKLSLQPGDTLHFSSRLFHAFRGTGGAASRALFVFSDKGTTSDVAIRRPVPNKGGRK